MLFEAGWHWPEPNPFNRSFVQRVGERIGRRKTDIVSTLLCPSPPQLCFMAYFVSGFKRLSLSRYKNAGCCCVHFYGCRQQYNRTSRQPGNSGENQRQDSFATVSTIEGRQLSLDGACLTAQYLMYPPRFVILVVLIAMTACSSMAMPVQVVAAWSSTRNYSVYRNNSTSSRSLSQTFTPIEASSLLSRHLKSNRFVSVSKSNSLWSSLLNRDTIRNSTFQYWPIAKDALYSNQGPDGGNNHQVTYGEKDSSESIDETHVRKRRSLTADMSKSNMDALERLSRVFGIRRLPSPDKVSPHMIAPEYMTRLYQSITDSGGLTKANSPYNADIIRSFPDRGK